MHLLFSTIGRLTAPSIDTITYRWTLREARVRNIISTQIQCLDNAIPERL